MQERDVRTGSHRVFDNVQEAYNRPGYMPWLAEYNSDAKELAGFIYTMADNGVRITMNSFSWNFGRFCLRFARALQPYGLAIDALVICDGIYYSKFYWRAYSRKRRIVLPPNVGDVTLFVQRTEGQRLQGHHVVRHDGEGVPPIVVPGVSHGGMDDYEPFHEAALKIAEPIV